MMKKWFIIAAELFALLVLTVASFVINRHTSKNEMREALGHIENAIGEDWEKQTITEVSSLVYSDNEGNTIIYYVCLTTFYNIEHSNFSGLNTDAISAVINPDEAESSRACTVSDFPAAIYQKDGRAYLCWTITPELSYVIEYDPIVEKEADIFHMAESVPVNRDIE